MSQKVNSEGLEKKNRNFEEGVNDYGIVRALGLMPFGISEGQWGRGGLVGGSECGSHPWYVGYGYFSRIAHY